MTGSPTHCGPEQILTDNGRVFTGRFFHPPVEVRFDQICRDNGVEHLLTQPRSPTTTGKIERFHKALRTEFNTRQVFSSLRAAQGALNEWVDHYNTERPHRALDMDTPASRFATADHKPATHHTDSPTGHSCHGDPDRTGPQWVSRRVADNGVVCVAWQQVSVGKHRAGANCDVYVTDDLLQFWVGNELLKTVQRTSSGEVRKKRASVPGGRG